MKPRCVHCSTPVTALYVRYDCASSSEILKLQSCTVCDAHAVDPYPEREPLLVWMDLGLLRAEAYRHCLFNSNYSQSAIEGETSGKYTNKTMFLKRVRDVGYAVIVSRLVVAQLMGSSNAVDDESTMLLLLVEPTREIALKVFICSIDLVTQFLGTLGFLKVVCQGDRNNKAVDLRTLHLAIVIPTLFHIATLLLVRIWGDTDAVVVLTGTLLVCVFQGRALDTLVEAERAPTKPTIGKNQNMISRAIAIGALSMGLMLKWIGRLSLSTLGVETPSSPRQCWASHSNGWNADCWSESLL